MFRSSSCNIDNKYTHQKCPTYLVLMPIYQVKLPLHYTSTFAECIIIPHFIVGNMEPVYEVLIIFKSNWHCYSVNYTLINIIIFSIWRWHRGIFSYRTQLHNICFIVSLTLFISILLYTYLKAWSKPFLHFQFFYFFLSISQYFDFPPPNFG